MNEPIDGKNNLQFWPTSRQPRDPFTECRTPERNEISSYRVVHIRGKTVVFADEVAKLVDLDTDLSPPSCDDNPWGYGRRSYFVSSDGSLCFVAYKTTGLQDGG